jgi:hypothetical protein
MNSEKIILDLCGGTGAWSKPYKDAGYDVRVVTLPDNDVMTYIPPANVYGILAAPPCTMFSIARNDKTAKEPRDLRKGMEVVNACFRIIWECLYSPYRISENSLKFWAIENPDGYLKRFLGKPAFEFDPCDFGDSYTKRTHLWGIFKDPKKSPVKPIAGSMVKHAGNHYFTDLKEVCPIYQKKLGVDSRTIRRSITPEGFSKAFYEANR